MKENLLCISFGPGSFDVVTSATSPGGCSGNNPGDFQLLPTSSATEGVGGPNRARAAGFGSSSSQGESRRLVTPRGGHHQLMRSSGVWPRTHLFDISYLQKVLILISLEVECKKKFSFLSAFNWLDINLKYYFDTRQHLTNKEKMVFKTTGFCG